jgi:hypothetical protein
MLFLWKKELHSLPSFLHEQLFVVHNSLSPNDVQIFDQLEAWSL